MVIIKRPPLRRGSVRSPSETKLRVVSGDETFWLELTDSDEKIHLKYEIDRDEALELARDLIEELMYYYEEIDSEEMADALRRALEVLPRPV